MIITSLVRWPNSLYHYNRQVLNINPNYAEAYYNIGVAHTDKGDVDAAISSYKMAVKIKPDYADAYNNLGIAQQSRGDINGAINSYKKTIKINPSYADAYNNMGTSLHGKGDLDEAISSYKKAVKIKPDYADAYNNLGMSLKSKGDLKAAINSYKQALEINPYYAVAYINMGIALQEKGDIEAAIASYSEALKLNPNYAEAYFNIGISLYGMGEIEEAIVSFGSALKLSPGYAEAYNNMGIALKSKGELKAAISSYNKALEINPSFVEAYNNMGIALHDKGDIDAAIGSYKKALVINSSFYEAYNNMGVCLKSKGDLNAAIGSFKKALEINPSYAEAYNNIGIVLFYSGDQDAAIGSYKRAIELNPNYAEAHFNMGSPMEDKGELVAGIKSYEMALKIKPGHQAARASKLHAQSHICDWEAIELDRGLIATLGTSTESVIPFSILPLEDVPERHLIRAATFTKKLYGFITPLPLGAPPSEKPKSLRIGYFSADFNEHPVAYLIAKVLETHDRRHFEVYGYSIGPNKDDDVRRRLTKAFDVFDDVCDMSDKDIALLARQDKIDIAIDLTGYTKDHKTSIFAHRAAPVQINFLGYPGTTGADFIDYIIADPVLIPSSHEKYYSECILRLPNTYMPTDNTRPLATREMSRSEMGLPEVGFVFCCFNNNYKISPSEFDIWMRVLLKTEGSVLWMRNSNEWSKDNLCKHAQSRGVDPSRLVFAGRVPMDEHLARQKLADLFLDTFTFNAHTTAAEALWVGLPVVTKLGKSFSARVAASLLTAVGLPELITETEHEYEALILNLANNPGLLKQTRKKLAGTRTSAALFDTTLFTKHLEEGFQHAYQRYFDGKSPKAISVSK